MTMLFTNYLFRLRHSRSLSQKRLAFLALTSVRAISDFERGRRLPTLKIAMLMEIVLGVKVSEMYVDLYQRLVSEAISREDRFPTGQSTHIRERFPQKGPH